MSLANFRDFVWYISNTRLFRDGDMLSYMGHCGSNGPTKKTTMVLL